MQNLEAIVLSHVSHVERCVLDKLCNVRWTEYTDDLEPIVIRLLLHYRDIHDEKKLKDKMFEAAMDMCKVIEMDKPTKHHPSFTYLINNTPEMNVDLIMYVLVGKDEE